MATTMQRDRMKVATDQCQHPWGYVRRSILGIMCGQCGQRFEGEAGTAVVLKVAEEAIEAAYERIEHLENIISERLDLTTCQTCGRWFTKRTNRGIMLKVDGGDVHLCSGHLAEWYEEAGFETDAQHAEVEVQLARWFIRHDLAKMVADLDYRAQFDLERLRGQLRPVIELQAARLP